jgi:phage gpG-like protein
VGPSRIRSRGLVNEYHDRTKSFNRHKIYTPGKDLSSGRIVHKGKNRRYQADVGRTKSYPTGPRHVAGIQCHWRAADQFSARKLRSTGAAGTLEAAVAGYALPCRRRGTRTKEVRWVEKIGTAKNIDKKNMDFIHHSVFNTGVLVGTPKKYGAIHQFGGMAGRNKKVKIPARPYLVAQPDDIEQIKNTLLRYLAKGAQ